MIGFTSSGISGGSLAALIQSGLVTLKSGSLFSKFQSLGASSFFKLIASLGTTASTACLAAF